MTIVAAAQAKSTAPPARFFDRWVDHDTWSEWSPDTDWIHLDGPVIQGATGTLKPKGGPKVRFAITELAHNQTYVDTSRFPGARLIFGHLATTTAAGTVVDVEVRIEGPLALVWSAILGRGFRKSVVADLQRLVRLVESRGTAVLT